MDAVIEWLNKNDLGELIPVFEREKINSLVRVQRLNEEMIKEFIPQIGPRADFLECWAALKSVQGETNSTVIHGSGEVLLDNVLETTAPTIIAEIASFVNLKESSNTQPMCTDDESSVISILKVETVQKNFDQDSGNGYLTDNLTDPLILPTLRCSSATSSVISSESGHSQVKRKYSGNSDRFQSKHLSASKGLENLKSLNVEELLESDLTSEAAVLYYKKHGCLTEPGRQAIVLVVVRELMKINHSPSHAEYELITEKLCKLFADEEAEIYYCPPVGAQKNPTGKLPNKVRNVKYALTKQNAAPISKLSKSNTSAEFTFAGKRSNKIVRPAKLSGSTDKNDQTIQSAISILKHQCTDSWPELMKSWSTTHALRFKYLISTRIIQPDRSSQEVSEAEDGDEDTLVNDYFKEWTILATSNGYLLICQDFAELYPGKENGLLAKWEQCRNLIVELATKELSKSDLETRNLLDSLTEIPEGAQDVTVLYLLVTLCCKRGRAKGSSKAPLLLESRKSFMLHAKIPGDLSREIRNYRQNLKSRGLRLQPLMVFVGPSIADVTASYVQIDNIRYKLRTPLAAVDTCFKAFHALDADYPVESQAVWLLIQRFFYEMYLEEDANIGRVLTVQSSLNALRSKRG